MKSNEEAIKRLLRPPSVANWARHNFRRLDDTERGLLRFAKIPPQHSLSDVYTICEAIVTDRISLKQAEACIDHIKHPQTRKSAREIVPCFFSYAQEQKLEGLPAFKGFKTPYPIGRAPDGSTLTIPVVPTFTLLQDGRVTPVFMIGWSALALTGYQKHLLSTIIRNAILTQQDFLGSDGLVICTPRFKQTEMRIIHAWSVRDYAVLSEQQLHEQFERYGTALEAVVRTLRSE